LFLTGGFGCSPLLQNRSAPRRVEGRDPAMLPSRVVRVSSLQHHALLQRFRELRDQEPARGGAGVTTPFQGLPPRPRGYHPVPGVTAPSQGLPPLAIDGRPVGAPCG